MITGHRLAAAHSVNQEMSIRGKHATVLRLLLRMQYAGQAV
jgi:hypothetical protein